MMMHCHQKNVALLFAVVLCLCSLGIGPSGNVDALSRPSVTAIPNVVGMQAAYSITFTTDRMLPADSGITVQFPAGTALPCTSCNPYVSPQKILINGRQATHPGFGDRTTMTIVVYLTSAVQAGDQLTIVLDSTVGIKNPEHAGIYSLHVWTVAEQTPVESAGYAVGESRLSSVLVQPDADMAGSSSGYHIVFITGAAGALSPDSDDTVSISFGGKFTLPLTIPVSAVLVNGKEAHSISVDATAGIVTVGVPVSVQASAEVTVDIAQPAGIVNPPTQGSYYVLVHTSRDVGDVSSLPFSILAKPAVSGYLSVTPSAPDGNAGWFRTTPVVTLEGISNVAGVVTVEWMLDDGSLNLYADRLSVPDGIHTLRFRARNDAASLVESGWHEFVFRVDTAQPHVVFDWPEEPHLLNANPVIVRGHVSAGTSPVERVEFGGRTIVLREDGSFEEQFILAEGKNRFLFMVRSISGRVMTEEWTATLDTTPPSLTITSPRNWQRFSDTSLVVSGVVETGTILNCQQKTVDVGPDGTWSATVSLTAGQNVITAVAIDAAGNKRTASVVVLSDPRTRVVTLTIGSAMMSVDGVSQELDPGRSTVPIIMNGRTMIPISSIMRVLGGTVEWDAANRRVTLMLGMKTVVLTIGQSSAIVDGKLLLIDSQDARVVPVIRNSRTMLPFRFVAEQLGGTVEWNAETRTVVLHFGAS